MARGEGPSLDNFGHWLHTEDTPYHSGRNSIIESKTKTPKVLSIAGFEVSLSK